ncbi:MAG: FadR/GntR family transcriptional regulator [Alphaproteobacteria bacterium]|nr:FadR/GntR family transcriptional regulator [Alphaproteobacteria bacterium]
MSKPTLPRPSAHAVARDIAAKIAEGVWPEGHQLPPERELAEQYGLARNTVRSALTRLEREGHVIRQVGRGTFVRGPVKPGRGVAFDGMTEASPADLMEIRLIIEPRVAQLAAHRASEDDLAKIETALRQSVLAKGTAEFEHWDAELHLAIFKASKNAALVDYCMAINAVRNQPRWYRLKQRAMTLDLRYLYDKQHTAIVTALMERDVAAAKHAVEEHLQTVRQNLLSALP